MKELSIEEKAKAYDEAKARMSKACNSNRCTIGFMNEIFPELKESEDEREELINYLKGIRFVTVESAEKVRNWIVWLEKQGKKKSIDYTHTNVFTEKAAIWFNNNFIVHDEYGVISDSFDTKEEMFEDFKNYMKGE